MLNHKEFRYKIGVYKIHNLVNNKSYVGSSCSSLYKRIQSHLGCLKNNKHPNIHLQNAWNKYGEKNFVFEVLEECDTIENCLKKEQFWINKLNTCNSDKGYNIYEFPNSKIGNKWSFEAKEKRKGFGKNRIVSEETKKKQALWHLGKKVKESTKQKLRDLPKNNKKVVMTDLSGNILKEFKNATEASKFFNLKSSTYICRVLSGKRKTCKGFRLFLKDEYNIQNIQRIVKGNTTEIIQYDLNNNKLKEFLSLKEAEEYINKKGGNANIAACCKGKRKQAYGYIWKYKNN